MITTNENGGDSSDNRQAVAQLATGQREVAGSGKLAKVVEWVGRGEEVRD